MERDIAPYCSTFYLEMEIRKKDNSLTSASFDILLTAGIPADRYETGKPIPMLVLKSSESWVVVAIFRLCISPSNVELYIKN